MGVPARYLLRHPDFYQEPLKFDPTRFSEERDEKKKAGFFWVAWGAGRHPCLGTRFATLEILVTVGAILPLLELSLPTKHVDISKGQMGTADKPIKPVRLTYRSR